MIASAILSPQYYAKRNFCSESAATLEAESGYSLEAPEVTEFRQYILSADWANAESLLSHLTTTDEEAIWVRSTRVRIVELDDSDTSVLRRPTFLSGDRNTSSSWKPEK